MFLRILTSCRMSIAAVVSNIDCFIVVKSKYCYLPPAAILSLKFRKQHIVSVSCIPLLFSNSSFFPNNGANIFQVLSTRLKSVHWYLSCYLPISSSAAIITGIPNGVVATPMAVRACCPTSGPNNSKISSEHP